MTKFKLNVVYCLAVVLLFSTTMGSLFAQSQDLIITGKVLGENNDPLIGVSITANNEKSASQSDVNGNFSIKVASSESTLTFSYLGYEKKTVTVGQQTTLNVTLRKGSTALLDEIVVVGYGTQKARNVTGAISRVNNAQIKEVPVISLDQALTGRVAGVQVTENSGEPGGEISIKIRGLSSINGSSEPLVVIDGVPTSVSLRAINPSDIENIEILKDAAASAIYGSRGSAGVILVTTKKGTIGKTTISFNAFTGVQNTAKRISVLNAEQFSTLANENLVNGGRTAWAPFSAPPVYNTDWQDQVFADNAQMQNYTVSIASGTEKLKSYFSLGYQNTNGIVITSNYERINSLLNVDYNVTKKIKVGASANFGWDSKAGYPTQDSFNGILIGALKAQPTNPAYTDITGRFGANDHLLGYRGYALESIVSDFSIYTKSKNILYQSDRFFSNNTDKNTTLLSTFFAEAELLEGLKFKSTLGYNIGNNNQTGGIIFPEPLEWDVNQSTFVTARTGLSLQWNLINSLNYEKTIGKHYFSVLAATDALKQSGRFLYARGENPPAGIPSITASSPAGRTASGSEYVPNSLMSYIGRVNYNFDEKYLISASLRRDGSSKFIGDNRWGVFPAVSAAWRISQEDFMKSFKNLDELKLRASYGAVGNQNVPDLQFVTQYGNNNPPFYSYSFGVTPASSVGLRPTVIGNDAIQWETKVETNIGIDASFYNGALNFTLDLYKKTLNDLLGTIPIPFYSSPFSESIYGNAFSMVNNGVEVSAAYNKKVGQFSFTVGGNFAAMNNEVTSLIPGNTAGFLSAGFSVINGNDYNDGNPQTRTLVGRQVGDFYGYVFDGIIQNPTELAASGMGAFGVKVGDKRFKDISGPNGVPDGVVDNLDKTFLGNGIPGFTYGVNLRAEFKGFDLSAFLTGQGDVQIANMTKVILYNMRDGDTGLNNVSTDLLNSWTPTNPSNTIPRNAYNAPTSNRFFASDYISSGAYLRMRNIALGYTIPAKVASKIGISNTRIYVSGQNLFTITDYNGYDPEVGSSTVKNQSRAQTAGVDYGRYPAAKMYTIGLSTQF